MWNCSGCGMLYEKDEEHERVPYDPENFLSPEYRKSNAQRSIIRWSGRMKQFEINRGDMNDRSWQDSRRCPEVAVLPGARGTDVANGNFVEWKS